MNTLVDFGNPYAIVGALFLLVVIAIVVWGLLRPKRPAKPAPDDASPSEAEMAYLDSSHIISGPLVGSDGARVIREPPAPRAAGDRHPGKP